LLAQDFIIDTVGYESLEGNPHTFIPIEILLILPDSQPLDCAFHAVQYADINVLAEMPSDPLR
jgi:hypothetical protein